MKRDRAEHDVEMTIGKRQSVSAGGLELQTQSGFLRFMPRTRDHLPERNAEREDVAAQVNALAEHELHVARYYMKRKAFVAALNRSKYVLENYPQSTSVEEALIISISAYDELGMADLKQDTLRVLETNYPNSRMLGKGVPEDNKVWWKFWESL